MAVDAEHETKLQAMQQQQRNLEAAHKKAIRRLQQELDVSHANHHRMEANVSKLLDDTATDSAQAREAAQVALNAAAMAQTEALAAQTAAAASSSRVEELSHRMSDNSLTSIAAKLGVGGKVEAIPSLNRVGARGDVCSRRMTDVAAAVESAVAVVLESTPLGERDPKAILERIREKRDGASTVVGKALRELREQDSAAGDEAVKVLGEAWIKNIKVGDKAMARTILGVLVSIRGVTQAEMIKACSYTPALEVGGEVIIKVGRNQRKRGRCVSVRS